MAVAVHQAPNGQPRRGPPRIGLLGGFSVHNGDTPVHLPVDAQRLVAFLALQGTRVPRVYVAGTLWADGTQDRAFGNLRSALWRLRRHTDNLVTADSQTLGIAPTAFVDIDAVATLADRLCKPDGNCPDTDLNTERFAGELLPGWYDEWAMVERERLRQVSLHALEALADRLAGCGRHGEAIQSALAAIRLDPLRESGHRCLIRVHLDEGNYSEALRQYDRCRVLLHDELGIQPSPQLRALLEGPPDSSR